MATEDDPFDAAGESGESWEEDICQESLLMPPLDEGESMDDLLGEFEDVARSLQLGELGLAGSPRVEDEAWRPRC